MTKPAENKREPTSFSSCNSRRRSAFRNPFSRPFALSSDNGPDSSAPIPARSFTTATTTKRRTPSKNQTRHTQRGKSQSADGTAHSGKGKKKKTRQYQRQTRQSVTNNDTQLVRSLLLQLVRCLLPAHNETDKIWPTQKTVPIKGAPLQDVIYTVVRGKTKKNSQYVRPPHKASETPKLEPHLYYYTFR